MLLITVLITILLPIAYGAPSNYIEEPGDMGQMNGTVYTISPFSPKVFVRSAEFLLNYQSCVQFRYKLMEKKVRLRAYTCLHDEGGYCTLDKFSFPSSKEGCYFLQPWTYEASKFAFYFTLEQRPRKFGNRRQRLRLQKRGSALSSRTIGQIEVNSIMPCKSVCGEGAAAIKRRSNRLN